VLLFFHLHSLSILSSPDADLQELSRIRGIGDKTIDKIREVINHGKIQRREQLENNEYFKTMELFNNVCVTFSLVRFLRSCLIFFFVSGFWCWCIHSSQMVCERISHLGRSYEQRGTLF
jgi:hypothetical protein